MKRATGFTMIELVVSITIAAVVVGFATMFMSSPVDAYFAQARRAETSAATSGIESNFEIDLQKALPNSIRIRNVGSRAIVEMLLADQVTFFRGDGTVGVPERELRLNLADSRFASLGRFDTTQLAGASYSVTGHLVLNNLGTPGFDAYQMTNVITPRLTINVSPGAIADEDDVQLSSAATFTTPPPAGSRIYFVSHPVTYICNSNARTLRRFSEYPINAGIPLTEAAAQLNGPGSKNALLANNVTACSVTCSVAVPPGPACQRSIALEITLTTPTPRNGNEVRRLFIESPVVNIP